VKHLHVQPTVRRAALAAAAVALVATAGAAARPARTTQPTRSGPHARAASAYAGVPVGVAKQLARTKAVLDRYRSVDAAKADGYALGSPCAMSPVDAGQSSYGGAMGVHFVNDALLKSGKLDPARPPILTYQPLPGGGMRLLAAEYFKPDADQDVKTDSDRPILFGRAFDGPMLGHSPGMPIHFDLHVWLWKHNPTGLFSPWNPDVTC
jgi:hypothetical protein